jgi:hypothetical protein
MYHEWYQGAGRLCRPRVSIQWLWYLVGAEVAALAAVVCRGGRLMADNLLYYGDNLDILQRYVKDETVDLVYLDPPFKSNQDYNVLFGPNLTLMSPAAKSPSTAVTGISAK